LDKYANHNAVSVAKWCQEFQASAVGIDAPCRWSLSGRARAAERALMKEKIWCFSTPTLEMAVAHPKKNYDWMLSGAELFHLLIEASYNLFDGANKVASPVCFETFPHAVACALAGEIVSAKRKGIDRPKLLKRAGIDTISLNNIDFVDAALCAHTAYSLLDGNFKAYGDAAEGLIVVPTLSG
jgi:predicted nuclease with RNAse H fold